MFKSLRNRLILINLGVTTMVILVAFTGIYISSTNSASKRPPMTEEKIEMFSDDMEKIVRVSIEDEKQAAAESLLKTLIISGVAIEVIVAIISYFLAEEAVRPVREAYETQKIFIANASHEIKTPLAAIAANLEAAEISGNKWIDNVTLETEKLAKLNGELLTLARADLVKKQNLEEVDVSEILEAVLKSFNPRLRNLNLQKKIIKTKKMKINREDLEQILSILLDNAVKYSEKKIKVEFDGAKIAILNDGAGISEKDLAHVFERFYQADKSAEGVGLGLSIAKTLAERNGWVLSVQSEKLTTFTLKF